MGKGSPRGLSLIHDGIPGAKSTPEGPRPFSRTVMRFRSLEASAHCLLPSLIQQTWAASPWGSAVPGSAGGVCGQG